MDFPAPAPPRNDAAPPAARLPALHLLLALAIVAVWGTNFVVIHAALREFPPLLPATIRFVLAAFPALLLVPMPKASWRAVVGYGLSIGPGQFGLIFIAMNGMIPPGLASLVIQSQVFFTIGLSSLLYRERVSPAQIAALVLGAAGLLIIAFHGNGGTTIAGLLLVVAAGLGWAIGNLIARANRETAMLPLVIWGSLAAVPPLLILSLAMEGPHRIAAALVSASIGGWAAAAWQAFGNTLFGFGAWAWLLSRHPAASVTPLALLVPFFGMGTAALLVGEPLPAWKLAAAALVVGGVALGLFQRARR